MGREEVMRHKAVAKTDKFWVGPWEPDMWIKTAVHKLETWVPTSAEQALRRQERAAGAKGGSVANPTPEVPQGRSVNPGPSVVHAEIVEEAPDYQQPADKHPRS